MVGDDGSRPTATTLGPASTTGDTGSVGARGRLTGSRFAVHALLRRPWWPLPAPAGPRPTPGAAGPLTWLSLQLERERDGARWPLATPLAFGTGIASYFAFASEPSLLVLLALVAMAGALRALATHGTIGPALTGFLLFAALGVLAGKLETLRLAAPRVPEGLGMRQVTGRLVRVEQRAEAGLRLTLAPEAIEGLASEALPARVRIVVRLKETFQPPAPGQTVRIAARLQPPPLPAEPGGYDFARAAWFRGIGGVGFAVGPPVVVESSRPIGVPTRMAVFIEQTREVIAERIRAGLGGREGALLVALVTGDRSAIPEATVEALRDAGLSHVLAISGLHMAVVAGTVFWALRLALAGIPALALRWPIKTIAALLALVAATLYLMVSGASLATQRAFIMLALMFLASMLGRPAISLRNVALAALAILAFTPHALLDVGFQMSFAAVVGLVAFYEAWRDWQASRGHATDPRARRSRPLWRRPLDWALGLFAGVGATTLIASLAVAPIAAFHFHTFAQLSLVANLLAVPVVTLVIMPLALVALLAMPFGLEGPVLALVAPAIALVAEIALWVQAQPGAVRAVAEMPVATIGLFTVGALWVVIWRGRWRLLGVLAVMGAVVTAPMRERPDVLIGQAGRPIAIRLKDGQLSVEPRQARSFSWQSWLKSDGDTRDPVSAATGKGFQCDQRGCTAMVQGLRIAAPLDASALVEDCRLADIVIARTVLPAGCDDGRLAIGASQLRRGGVHAIRIGQDGELRIETARETAGLRPWNAPVPRAGARPAAPRDPEGSDAATPDQGAAGAPPDATGSSGGALEGRQQAQEGASAPRSGGSGRQDEGGDDEAAGAATAGDEAADETDDNGHDTDGSQAATARDPL